MGVKRRPDLSQVHELHGMTMLCPCQPAHPTTGSTTFEVISAKKKFVEESHTKPTLNKLLRPCCVSTYIAHATHTVAAWAFNTSRTPELAQDHRDS